MDLNKIDTIKEIAFRPKVEKLVEEFSSLMKDYPHLCNKQNVTITNTTTENDWDASSGLAKDLDNPPRDYNVVVDALAGSYIDHIITRKFPGSYRWRLWQHLPNSCLRPHRDTDYRIHIPIVTDPASFLVLLNNNPEDGAWNHQTDSMFYHMELGKAYILNTFKYAHGVLNFSGYSRWHLVGSIG